MLTVGIGGMNSKDYQNKIKKFDIYPMDIALLTYGLGLGGESGEVQRCRNEQFPPTRCRQERSKDGLCRQLGKHAD